MWRCKFYIFMSRIFTIIYIILFRPTICVNLVFYIFQVSIILLSYIYILVILQYLWFTCPLVYPPRPQMGPANSDTAPSPQLLWRAVIIWLQHLMMNSIFFSNADITSHIFQVEDTRCILWKFEINKDRCDSISDMSSLKE